jgi:hypothetical protein
VTIHATRVKSDEHTGQLVIKHRPNTNIDRTRHVLTFDRRFPIGLWVHDVFLGPSAPCPAISRREEQVHSLALAEAGRWPRASTVDTQGPLLVNYPSLIAPELLITPKP